MAKQRFRVLRGCHAETGPDGKLRVYGRNQPLGDIIETDTDLVARFNSPDSIKFDRVDASAMPNAYPIPKPNKMPPQASMDTLKSMSVEELIKFAAEEEIDLKGEKNRDKILSRIQSIVGGK